MGKEGRLQTVAALFRQRAPGKHLAGTKASLVMFCHLTSLSGAQGEPGTHTCSVNVDQTGMLVRKLQHSCLSSL